MLKAEKVCLRAIEKEDLPQLLTWRNQPEYRRYFREYRELSMENQTMWYERVVLQDRNTLMFSIIDQETHSLIGACGLCYIDWVNKSADFSIYIGKDNIYIDDFFAPDAGKLLVKYGFEELGLHRIWAEIYDFDEPKKRLFDQLGFTQDGKHRETHWSEGKWHDSLFYSILVND
ncbi:GNAT family N-acetyltransferase [Aneurinibacillus uraniidurans]|uniref:GNAT family N-acetyltransferase n=1 Tax=Aneurinibacillus uraniidurans TaxID=2966586 RepID=UPI0023498D48|nr:GNAT family protein [Aneurinibacillus sp. B1]WCN38143.1 GNAT family protein [Aneurinibacillus sp. B1]